jgi:hypothetical protein
MQCIQSPCNRFVFPLRSSASLTILIKLLCSVQINKCPTIFNLGLESRIHIHGHPASGKTHLLYFLLATCLVEWKKAAVVFDMDGRFNISRFKQLLVSRLSTTTIVDRCLKNIHIFRPSSSDQLAVTLAHLPKYHAKHFPDIALGIVAIHSVDALTWLDRFKAEQLRLPHSASQNISSILETIRLSLGSVVVLTDWGLVHKQVHAAQVNSHPNPMDLPHIHQITLSVIDTSSEDRHSLGVVKVPGRTETRNFTLKVGSNAMSVNLE